jgi:hypothetical protein
MIKKFRRSWWTVGKLASMRVGGAKRVDLSVYLSFCGTYNREEKQKERMGVGMRYLLPFLMYFK